MPEIPSKADTYIIEYICDKCNIGTLEYMELTSHGGKYGHVCTNPSCKHSEGKDKKYPYNEIRKRS